MVVAITKTAQLSIFDTLKGVLKSNSTLSRKLRDNDYYEYEPNLQSLSFKQIPYIAMVTQSTESEKLTIGSRDRLKNYTVEFVLVMDYQARDKFREYAEAIIRQIELSQSTFEAQGVYDMNVDLSSSSVELVNSKQVVTGTFTLTYSGVVER